MTQSTKTDPEPKSVKPSDDKRELTITELDGVAGGGTSSHNQTQTTLSSIQKNLHDAKNVEIGKI